MERMDELKKLIDENNSISSAFAGFKRASYKSYAKIKSIILDEKLTDLKKQTEISNLILTMETSTAPSRFKDKPEMLAKSTVRGEIKSFGPGIDIIGFLGFSQDEQIAPNSLKRAIDMWEIANKGLELVDDPKKGNLHNGCLAAKSYFRKIKQSAEEMKDPTHDDLKKYLKYLYDSKKDDSSFDDIVMDFKHKKICKGVLSMSEEEQWSIMHDIERAQEDVRIDIFHEAPIAKDVILEAYDDPNEEGYKSPEH